MYFRRRELFDIRRDPTLLARYHRACGQIAQSLIFFAIEERCGSTDQIKKRKTVDQSQQIADDDLRKLQTQALGIDHAQLEEALADGLATPSPLEHDAVTDPAQRKSNASMSCLPNRGSNGRSMDAIRPMK